MERIRKEIEIAEEGRDISTQIKKEVKKNG